MALGALSYLLRGWNAEKERSHGRGARGSRSLSACNARCAQGLVGHVQALDELNSLFEVHEPAPIEPSVTQALACLSARTMSPECTCEAMSWFIACSRSSVAPDMSAALNYVPHTAA